MKQTKTPPTKHFTMRQPALSSCLCVSLFHRKTGGDSGDVLLFISVLNIAQTRRSLTLRWYENQTHLRTREKL